MSFFGTPKKEPLKMSRDWIEKVSRMARKSWRKKRGELAPRAEPKAGHGGKNAAKWNASQRVMAVIIPPKCTMMLAELAARAEPKEK